MNKHIPLRKCTGCGEMKPKNELIRIVKSSDTENDAGEILKGSISIDLTGKASGRGAYICKDGACLKVSRKARRLEKTFGCKVPDEIYDELTKLTESNA